MIQRCCGLAAVWAKLHTRLTPQAQRIRLRPEKAGNVMYPAARRRARTEPCVRTHDHPHSLHYPAATVPAASAASEFGRKLHLGTGFTPEDRLPLFQTLFFGSWQNYHCLYFVYY